MVSIVRVNPLVRAVLVVGAIAGLVVGVTYAALSSSASLTGNTISATAGLQLSTDSGATYGSSIAGFPFEGVTPGDTTGVTKNFKLKNATTTGMTGLTLKIPTAVTFTGGVVDGSKVHVNLVCTTPDLTLSSNLTALSASEVTVTGTPLAAGAIADCAVTVTMDSDAITSGGPVTSGAFELRFTGTAS